MSLKVMIWSSSDVGERGKPSVSSEVSGDGLLKIAFWNSSFLRGIGGAELCTAELLNSLAGEGETCYLLTSIPEPGGSGIMISHLDERIAVRTGVFHNPFKYRKKPLSFLIKLSRYAWSTFSLAFWLYRERIHLVHQHYTGIDVVMLALLKRFLGFRLVVTYHGQELDPNQRLSRWKNRVALDKADEVVVVSHDQRELLSQLRPDRDIHVIPNGLDIERVIELAGSGLALDIPPDHFVFCGRLHPVKQVPDLVNAFALAIKKGCSRNLYIIGSGPDDTRIRTAIREAAVEQRVFLVPAQPREIALGLMKNCCSLLLNSASEGYPMVILEAMALGKAVIAPDVGEIGSMVRHGESALVFPAGDTQALVAAILELDRDDQFAKQLGAAAQKTVMKTTSLEQMTRSYHEVYHAALSGGNTPA